MTSTRKTLTSRERLFYKMDEWGQGLGFGIQGKISVHLPQNPKS